MSRLGQGLAGVSEVHLEAGQGVDSSLERRSQPACELVRGARLVDADEQRFDRAVFSGAEPGELVGGTAPRKAGHGTRSAGSARDQRRDRERVKARPRMVVYRFHPDVVSNRKPVSRLFRASHRWM